MAEGEAPAPAALIEPDERSTVSLWSSTMRQANKVDEIALILKKMTALETKLADLEGERIKVREGSEALPSGPLQLHGALLECAKEVRVLTGPVVGRVDSRSAVILLETDVSAKLEVVVCLQAEGKEVRRQPLKLKGRRPGIVVLTQLQDDTRYQILFSGIHRQDARERIAEFVTLKNSVRAGALFQGIEQGDERDNYDEARFVAVARDRPSLVKPGEFNRWDTIYERVSQKDLPPVNFMLHVGGQVDLQSAFEEAWTLLKRGCIGEDDQKALEDKAREILRRSYRHAWNLPHVRETLASCPHFMLCGEGDVYPKFLTNKDLGDDVGACALRCARRVYWEYQRQLWDPRVHEVIEYEESYGKTKENIEKAKEAVKTAEKAALAAVKDWERYMSEKAEIRSQVAHLDGVELRRELRKVKCPVVDGRTDAQLREDYLKHKALGLDESKPLPTWPPHEAHQAVDAARAAGAAKDAGASDSFSYGMAAPAPAAKTVSFQEDGLDDDSEEEEESEEEDEDFVKRDPDDTKERRYEARVAELGAAVNEAEQTAKDMQERFENWGNADTPNAGKDNETALHILGRIGVLLLDTRWSQISDRGAQQKDEPLVAEDTWKQLEHLLLYGTYAGSITALVVCTDEPPVDPYQRDDLPEESYARLAAISSRWARHESDREAFLGLMFRWLQGMQNRSLVVICGGDLCGGVETQVEDQQQAEARSKRQEDAKPKLDEWGQPIQELKPVTENVTNDKFYRQLVCGGVAGSVTGTNHLMGDGGELEFNSKDDRGKRQLLKLQYDHRRLIPSEHCAYVEGLVRAPVDATEPVDIRADICSLFFGGVKVTVGPVIGLVTESTAIILLEVEWEAPVGCVITDALSGERMTILNHLPKLRPHAFRVEGLKPHRHYHVRFDGVEDPEKRRGSFTTCASLAAPRRPQPGDDVDGCGGSLTAPYQKSFRGLCLSRDTPATDKTSAADGAALLSACREALDEAFAGTDCVFHLGGQVNLDAVQADAAGVLAQAENAYVRGDEAQAGMLEDRAMQRLRDAYRTHWNLPGTREVLSRGGRVMVPGDADLGNTLLRNATEGYVRRTLRRMTQRVYREYQRQLWEPLLPTAEAAVSYATAAVDSTTLRFGATHPWGATPGVAAEARRGCAPVSSHGEWHFHQWCGGAVGLFAFDTKHERLYNGGACLIGEDQWAALDAALEAPGLRCAYVASDTPFVDRSFADAAALAAQDSSFSHTWPARGDELLRLFQRLEDWEAGHAARRAFLLSGGTPCALQTELALRGAGNATAAALRAAAPAPAPPAQPRRQLLIHACGPVTAPSDKPDFELRGTLNADYTYAHTATKRQSVSIVMATWDAEAAQMACAVVPPDGTRFFASVFWCSSDRERRVRRPRSPRAHGRPTPRNTPSPRPPTRYQTQATTRRRRQGACRRQEGRPGSGNSWRTAARPQKPTSPSRRRCCAAI